MKMSIEAFQGLRRGKVGRMGSRALCKDEAESKDVHFVGATSQVDQLAIVRQLLHESC